jgi:uracil-DNA glycosylase
MVEAGLVQRQVEWAHRYNGYARLAASPEDLLRLIAPLRADFEAGRGVPEWAGVDLLRGWAFYVTREDRHGGGYGLSDLESSTYAEWRAVLDRLATHPDAMPADRPPISLGPEPTFTPSTRPRMHKVPEFLAAKQARWDEPHIAPINALSLQMTREGLGDVPRIDPDSGGIHARVMFLLEAPARAAAHSSGMLSADNDDATAQHVWEAYAESGLRRAWGIHWNVVPWYVGTDTKIRAVTPAETWQGVRWTRQLLDLLPNLRVIVAMGVAARNGAALLEDALAEREIALLTCMHPSPRNYNTRPHARAEVLATFREARRIASR